MRKQVSWFPCPVRRALLWLPIAAVLLAGPGALLRGEAQGDPSVAGSWSPVLPWSIVSINAHVLPNGKVMLWGRNGGTEARIWDPKTDQVTPVANTRTNLFCSSHVFLPDGRLFVTGGHIEDGVGQPHVNIFDFRTNAWKSGPDMNAGRWYPTAVVLGNGDVLVASGAIVGNNNEIPQVWRPSTGWRTLTGARMGLPLYPFLHLAPNGKVVMTGPGQTTYYLDPNGTGSWTPLANSSDPYRDYGTSVMYDNGKILLIGGHDPPTNTCEVLDLNAATPRWRLTNPMRFPRRQLNATLLPDGRVLVTGGTSSGGFNDATGQVLPAEIWDPETEAWTTMNPMTERRLYHSTALLLPDGRVFSGGGGQPAATGGDFDHYSVEIFAPPYLHQPGARPRILSAPRKVTYGQRFFVRTKNGASIRKVNWLRLSSVTHAFNSNQRINRLSFTRTSGGLTVTAPANGNLCPPGHYMLFLIDSRGVPSESKIIRVDRGIGIP